MLGGALVAIGAGLTGCSANPLTVESTGTAPAAAGHTPATTLVVVTDPAASSIPATTAAASTTTEGVVFPFGNFGEPIDVGPLEEVLADIDAAVKLYVPNARAWLVHYPPEHVDAAKGVYQEVLHEGLDLGILALYQKCTHLGCRVPECAQSGQFECPCHGSKYTGYGEKLPEGPAPRGLDLIPVRLAGGHVVLDSRLIVQGPPIGTDVTGWEPLGPGCVNIPNGP